MSAPRATQLRGVAVLACTVLAGAGLAGFGNRVAVRPTAQQVNRTVTTPPIPVTTVCPAMPVVQSTSTDKQFSAGAGVVASTVSISATSQTTQSVAVVPATAADSTTNAQGQPTPGQPGGGLVSVTTTAARLPMIATATPRDTTPQVFGVAAGVAPSGDLRGLVAGACTPPAQSTWLLGGHTSAGVGSRVVITNASEQTTTVDVRVLTPKGWLRPAVGTGQSIAGGASREILLRALVTGDLPTLAVSVTAKGADVHAQLVDQQVNGTDPAGIAVVSGAKAGRQLVLLGPAGAAGESVKLRLVNPGRQPASIGWRLEGGDAPASSTPKGLTLNASGITDITVPAAHGQSAVVVEADQPVLAALEISQRNGKAIQRSWVAGQPGSAQPQWLSLPAALGATPSSNGLLVASPGASVTVRRFNTSGAALPELPLDTGAGGVITVPAAALAGVVAAQLVPQAGQPVFAVLSVSDGKGLRALASVPTQSSVGREVTLQPAPDGSWP